MNLFLFLGHRTTSKARNDSTRICSKSLYPLMAERVETKLVFPFNPIGSIKIKSKKKELDFMRYRKINNTTGEESFEFIGMSTLKDFFCRKSENVNTAV